MTKPEPKEGQLWLLHNQLLLLFIDTEDCLSNIMLWGGGHNKRGGLEGEELINYLSKDGTYIGEISPFSKYLHEEARKHAL